MRLLLLFVLTFSAISCSKDKDNDDEKVIPSGTYKGTFQRQGAGDEHIANVTLNLNNATYNGQGTVSNSRYPAIGRGSYAIANDKITFQDSTYYTADFDWTLILSYEYQFSWQGDSLVMVRKYNNQARDVYKLKKQ